MGLGEVVVNRVARLGGTLVAESDLSSGILRTPQFIPKITTQPEFDFLLKGDLLRRPIEAVCYEILSVSRLTKKRNLRAKQRTVTLESADPVFDSFRRNVRAMVDPQSELFTYKRTYSGFHGEKFYIRQKIASLDDFPPSVREILLRQEAPWHEQFWREIVGNDLLITFIDWYATHQDLCKPAIFLPPNIVVDGNPTLDLSLAINDAAGRSFPPGEDGPVPAAYLILAAKVFKSPDFISRLLREVSGLANSHRLLAFKFLDQYDVVNDPLKCEGFGRFLSQLDGVKQRLGDGIINLSIDSGEPGLATLGNGIDAYAEPLSGYILAHQGGKTKEEKAKEDEALDLARPGYWLHPMARVEVPITAEEIAKICDCPVHKRLAQRIAEKPIGTDQTAGNPAVMRQPELRTDELTALRRIHHYNVRTREIELLAEAVGVGDATFLSRVLAMGSNQNLLKLLPKSDSAKTLSR